MSRFMETQVTRKISWVEIEQDCETYHIPADDVYPGLLVNNTITRRFKGYGVRESAPGYLDCTEWEVFPTLAEAEKREAEINLEYMDDDIVLFSDEGEPQ